jgi:hypothetical protein
VCGSREWDDYDALKSTVLGFVGPERNCTIIEGGAKGADSMAGRIAEVWRCGHERYPAAWDRYGKRAGPIRNQQMLTEGKPDLVLAFKDYFDWTLSKGGTEHMVWIAKMAGIPTYVISRR